MQEAQHIDHVGGLLPVPERTATDHRQPEQDPQGRCKLQAGRHCRFPRLVAGKGSALVPEGEQGGGQRLLLHKGARVCVALQAYVPEILAVTVLMEAVVSVIEDHRLGVTAKGMLTFGDLSEGR